MQLIMMCVRTHSKMNTKHYTSEAQSVTVGINPWSESTWIDSVAHQTQICDNQTHAPVACSAVKMRCAAITQRRGGSFIRFDLQDRRTFLRRNSLSLNLAVVRCSFCYLTILAPAVGRQRRRSTTGMTDFGEKLAVAGFLALWVSAIATLPGIVRIVTGWERF